MATQLPFADSTAADFKIQQGIGETRTPRFNTLTFGNTIQNIPVGINSIDQVYSISMRPLTEAELTTFIAFFELHTGSFGVLPSAFDFTPIGASTSQRYVFEGGLTISQLSGTIKEISFSIRRVYNE